MSRKEKWEFASDWYSSGKYIYGSPRYPQVEAHYRQAIRPHTSGYQVVNMPCMHPDGSIFYEYVEGTKKEV
jgi:hypothetical protein